ncbi:MAG TPA: MBL fold hydrolase [Bacteroidetes bacterium]|nr:MBL fold hydrolase [Bacteroidota bacterium]
MNIHSFTFNPFQENTYLLYDETKECVIIDPGCFDDSERNELTRFIDSQKLKPVLLLNTHAHIDHMLGNAFVKSTYNIPFMMHEKDLVILHAAPAIGKNYGFMVIPSPEPDKLIDETDVIKFGTTELKIFFTPGHAPGEISFYHHETKTLIAGDVLFEGSIGRYDFPNSNYEDLMQSIVQKFMTLDDDVRVFPGHGNTTTIGRERRSNPFLLEYLQS